MVQAHSRRATLIIGEGRWRGEGLVELSSPRGVRGVEGVGKGQPLHTTQVPLRKHSNAW